MEAAIFTAFIVVQIAVGAVPHVWGKVEKFAVVQRIARNHWIVWLFHPVVLHGLHDYAVHFVVYSGYIIQSH